jgi:hypothetical protein
MMVGTYQVAEAARRTGGPVDEAQVKSVMWIMEVMEVSKSTRLKVCRSSEGVKAMAAGRDGLVVNFTKRMGSVTGVHVQKPPGVADVQLHRWASTG